METKIKSSFIPKKRIEDTQHIVRKYKSSSIDIFTIIAVVVFMVSVVSAGIVWLQKENVVGTIDEQKESIKKIKMGTATDFIEANRILSSRLKGANALLSNHISISILFKYLEKNILKNIQIKKFIFKEINSNKATFEIDGIADSVNAVAVQARQLGASSPDSTRLIFKNIIFSDIDLVDDGVKFKATGDIDLSIIRFVNIRSGAYQNQVAPEIKKEEPINVDSSDDKKTTEDDVNIDVSDVVNKLQDE